MTKFTCIVTGGSSGIGLSIVKTLLKRGYHVCNLDLQDSGVGDYFQCDVTNHQQVQTIIKSICQQHRVSTLVSNAGIHFSANIEDTSEQDFQRVFDINVKGAYSAIQAVLPSMKENKNGNIILISSDQAVVGKRNSFAYNLSKAALASMVKTTALDYASYNIRANAVCPGTIETPLYHKAIDSYCAKSGANADDIHKEEAALQPLNRLGQPDEVAALVAFLASDEAKFITGSLQIIDGGYTAQ